ncbi:hypothetical protein [Komagataeibacter europaeus]|uniref:hypothetical protein n=1 Tax=Komagataeibacter europaeus TaxID=33995 RepID=UPI000237EDC9|nr:hypothetical protein [Komagataeibacter europaeus]
MGSPKFRLALEQLGHDLRGARLEKGDSGVGIGTLADLIDIRMDDLGLALTAERQPRRGRASATTLRRQQDKDKAAHGRTGVIDLDGTSF